MSLTRVRLKIRRQDRPDSEPYWQDFEVPWEKGMNVITCLQEIAARGVDANGGKTTPVVWDSNCLEEVCGACSMRINGKVRQACSALIENLVTSDDEVITLEPMSKFPVVRDLIVDRSRMFEVLKRIKGWIPVDGYYDLGHAPLVTPTEHEIGYALSRCMTCGCCLEACPQYHQDSEFIGAAALSQAMLFNLHPIGQNLAHERLDSLMEPGGIASCGNAQNCVKVCPKDIPLTDSIARAGRATTLYGLRKWLDS